MTVQARRGCGQTRMAGAYTDQRLNLSKLWEGPRKKCQGFKPDPGNPAVRDYRGASGNVSHGGNVHPSCNRKSRKRKPPTYSVARPISIPIHAFRRMGSRRFRSRLAGWKHVAAIRSGLQVPPCLGDEVPVPDEMWVDYIKNQTPPEPDEN